MNREKFASLIRIFNKHLVGPGDTPVNKTSAVQASGGHSVVLMTANQ